MPGEDFGSYSNLHILHSSLDTCVDYIFLSISLYLHFRWNHLWLNEGLTSFLQYYGLEAIREKSFVWQQYYLRIRADVIKKDVSSSQSRNSPLVPTSHWIKTEEHANQMFHPSWIRYGRGATMIAMLRSMIGEDALLSSINSYLTAFAHANVVTRDFFEFLDRPAKNIGAVSVDSHIREFMEPWVNRSGYPIVYLIRNMENNTVRSENNMSQISYKYFQGDCDTGENELGTGEGASRQNALVRIQYHQASSGVVSIDPY